MAGLGEPLTDDEFLAAIEAAEQLHGVESDEAKQMRDELRRRVSTVDGEKPAGTKALRRTTAAWPELSTSVQQQARRTMILVEAGVTRLDLTRGGAVGHVERLARQLGMPRRTAYRRNVDANGPTQTL